MWGEGRGGKQKDGDAADDEGDPVGKAHVDKVARGRLNEGGAGRDIRVRAAVCCGIDPEPECDTVLC